jgi:urease accessory protein
MAALESAATESSWRGALALDFAAIGTRTYVARRRHEGPFTIQRPFHPGDGACHVYLLHPPGGLAAGDELVLDAGVAADAAALLTTPASTKFYRSPGARSVQSQTLRVADGASLEWLPQDTILFGGSRAAISTDVHLARDARFLGWEMTALGRPHSGDRYADGALDLRTRIAVDGLPLLRERLHWGAPEPLRSAPFGLAGHDVWASLYAYPADGAALAKIRDRIGGTPTFDELLAAPADAAPSPRRIAATLLGPLLVIRCLAHRAEDVRRTFESLWCDLRPLVVGKPAQAPRIWRT